MQCGNGSTNSLEILTGLITTWAALLAVRCSRCAGYRFHPGCVRQILLDKKTGNPHTSADTLLWDWTHILDVQKV